MLSKWFRRKLRESIDAYGEHRFHDDVFKFLPNSGLDLQPQNASQSMIEVNVIHFRIYYTSVFYSYKCIFSYFFSSRTGIRSDQDERSPNRIPQPNLARKRTNVEIRNRSARRHRSLLIESSWLVEQQEYVANSKTISVNIVHVSTAQRQASE